jgi:hypothetical protein
MLKEEIRSMSAIRTAEQIPVDQIATRAATGVARALAVRQAAGVALSSEELSQVNGGGTLSGGVTLPLPTCPVIIWGLVPPPRPEVL